MLATYAGTGGIEGRVEQKGGVKPLALGAPLGVPGVLLDPVKSIFQLSGYGLIEAVDVPLERLARQFGSPVADYADYASLAAANVIAGTWVTAKAIGCVRMGAPPFGRLCFLMRGDKAGPDGWARRPGAMIKRLSQLAGGLSRTHVASLTALDAARPYDLSVFLGNQTDARSPIQSVAASVNAVAGVSLTGELFAIPVQINAEGLTLKADGSGLPVVAAANKLGLSAPWWRQAIGAQPFWDVHGQGDYVALQISAKSPDAPPDVMQDGGLYVDATNKQFRYTGPVVFSDEGDVTSDEGLVTSSGYEDIQDLGIMFAIEEAQSAQAGIDALAVRVNAIDDDDVVDVSEKVDVLIPQADAFAAAYTAINANASAAGVSVTTLNTKRTAWLSYLAAILPAWNDVSQPSQIVRGSLDAVRNEYDTELKTVQRLSIEAMTAAKTPDLIGNFQWDIAGDVTGAVTTSLPVDRRFKGMEGAIDKSLTTAFVLSAISPSLSLTVNNTVASVDRGVITLGIATTGSGTALLTATLPAGGVVLRTITVTKTNAIPATGGGSGSTFAQDTTFTSITGTVHGAISDELVVRSDASGNIRLSIDLLYSAAGGTSLRTPSFKASYATTSGGALTDLFTEASGSSCSGGTEPQEGYYTRAEATFAMPLASTDYYFKLQGRRSSGTGNISFNGTSFTVRQ